MLVANGEGGGNDEVGSLRKRVERGGRRRGQGEEVQGCFGILGLFGKSRVIPVPASDGKVLAKEKPELQKRLQEALEIAAGGGGGGDEGRRRRPERPRRRRRRVEAVKGEEAGSRAASGVVEGGERGGGLLAGAFLDGYRGRRVAQHRHRLPPPQTASSDISLGSVGTEIASDLKRTIDQMVREKIQRLDSLTEDWGTTHEAASDSKEDIAQSGNGGDGTISKAEESHDEAELSSNENGERISNITMLECPSTACNDSRASLKDIFNLHLNYFVKFNRNGSKSNFSKLSSRNVDLDALEASLNHNSSKVGTGHQRRDIKVEIDGSEDSETPESRELEHRNVYLDEPSNDQDKLRCEKKVRCQSPTRDNGGARGMKERRRKCMAVVRAEQGLPKTGMNSELFRMLSQMCLRSGGGPCKGDCIVGRYLSELLAEEEEDQPPQQADVAEQPTPPSKATSSDHEQSTRDKESLDGSLKAEKSREHLELKASSSKPLRKGEGMGTQSRLNRLFNRKKTAKGKGSGDLQLRSPSLHQEGSHKQTCSVS